MSLIKDLAYKTLDVVTHGSGISRNICGEEVRFPARFSRYYESDYEPDTFKFFREHLSPGDTVLDIGGHIGLFAVLSARQVGSTGKVFSFEPTPFTRSVLDEVVRLNGVEDVVEVREEAVSSTSGDTVFFDTGDEISNANSLVRSELSQAEIPIKLVSVDDFASERGLKIDCIKIDVEGAEMDVLTGARRTLIVDRPSVRLGLHPAFVVKNGQSLEDIWAILAECRMSISYEGAPVSRDWFCSRPDLFDVDVLPA